MRSIEASPWLRLGSSNGRAGSLLVEPAERSSLLCDLARALRGVGALEAADAALAEATEHARRHDDEATECRAEMERAHIAFMRSPPDADALREIAQRAIAVFDATGSDADLADAWQLMGVAELAAHERGAQLTALQKGREHAIASGDIRRQSRRGTKSAEQCCSGGRRFRKCSRSSTKNSPGPRSRTSRSRSRRTPWRPVPLPTSR